MTPSERPTPVTGKIAMPLASFGIGDVVRHRIFDFRGVVFDVDPVFANSEEWYDAIP
jgi:heat shock protein HspQ